MNYFHRQHPVTQSIEMSNIFPIDPVNRTSIFTNPISLTMTESLAAEPIGTMSINSQPELREHHVDNHPTYHLFKRIFQELENLDKQQKNELEWFKSHEFATKHDLKETEEKIMSKVSNFAATQSAFNDRMDIAVTDLQGDVSYLVTTINTLQNSSGSIFTDSDQALLDALSVRASGIATKLDALDAYASANSSGSVSGSVQGPLSGSFNGTYSGTVTDLTGSSATVSNATINGVGNGVFTGSIFGSSISGSYVGSFTGSVNNQVANDVILNGNVVGTYTVVPNASASLARQFKKVAHRL